MIVNNQNSPAFGSRFLIRELPVGNYYIVSGLIDKKIPKSINRANKKMNTRIDRLIKKLVDKFGATDQVQTHKYYSRENHLNTHLLIVDDSLDNFVQTKINSLDKKKHFWKSSKIPKVISEKVKSLQKPLEGFNLNKTRP